MNAPSPTSVQNRAPRPAPELSIVVPTFNAQDNVPLLVESLARGLGGIDWNVIFVDDNSADQTVAMARRLGESDPRVHALRRVGRNGLTQTCLTTMLASRARFVAMVQPEIGFDAAVLVTMLDRLRGDNADLVVATRDRAAGGRLRMLARAGLSAVTRRVLSTGTSDPTSGCFMMRRDRLEELTPSLSSLGYQVLLDLIATARGRLRIVELAVESTGSGNRPSEVKLALELLALLIARFSNDAVSIRFLLFCLVGLSGVGVHLALLRAALITTLPFTAAQTFATIGAMIWNFTLNNTVTYGDQRLRGLAYVTGLLRFMVICGIGAISNVGVASWIYAQDNVWWIAGLGGAVMGAVWNYAVSSVFVWRPR
jgi:dolichol-phosphate mannosyltransferase